jgi:6-pyruvoyltetrahydropterin/6-carboxytetrahydropterin synthase
MNISAIDAHVRERVIPIIETAAQRRDAVAPSAVLQQAFQALHEPMGEALDSVRWNLSPYYSLTMSAAAPNRVLITQSFEFAAAHRLHCDELDAERNRSIFGKCNNPSGHGHNYRVEVSAETSLDDRGVNAFSLVTLEGIVDDVVIRRFDHKHLNTDTAEFKNVNPSVEHITRACFDLLARPIAEAGATLRRVTVWETEKTSCTYPA